MPRILYVLQYEPYLTCADIPEAILGRFSSAESAIDRIKRTVDGIPTQIFGRLESVYDISRLPHIHPKELQLGDWKAIQSDNVVHKRYIWPWNEHPNIYD